MTTAAVFGARGYLGRELMRILLAHPAYAGLLPVSTSQAGTPYATAVPAFAGRGGLRFAAPDDDAVRDADVVFLATPSEEARAAAARLREDAVLVDLSRAHRHDALRGANGWHYGLADLHPVPAGARRIANPGCYPTATLLAAAPALHAGLAAEGVIISDGKSGVSGAGATPRGDLHYPEMNESMRAYRVLGHDHGAEIHLALARMEGRNGDARPVRFTPHLVPQNRGLLATVYIPLRDAVSGAQAKAAYSCYYEGHAFVHVMEEPDTAQVRGGNHAHVAADADEEAGLLVARCAIDNLIKGGAGQAVQNANLALGLPADTGLTTVGGGP